MKHFTIEELTRSATAGSHGIDNTPPPCAIANLKRLVEKILDPAREKLGMPIYVNSGYRCPELNRKVGGARKSYHLKGRAADIDTRNGNNRRLYQILRRMSPTELIYERGGIWIHVAL